MKKKNIFIQIFVVFLAMFFAGSSYIFGQVAGNTTAQEKFLQEELDQMLAPIALYSDSLLSQMLMAATYPLEIVEAARWVKENPNLNEDTLDAALQEKDWDVSVKSLAHFPQVLSIMDEKIEWSTRVGDAFLAQRDDVMDSIQKLRAKAEAAGYLQSTKEQKVVDEEGDITIEPSNGGVIYVPEYDPLIVYYPWWYPAFPPFAIYYPGVAFGGFFGFAVGFGFGWCDFDWHHHGIDIDYDRIGHFQRFDHERFNGRGNWEHNPDHRRGVAYWDRSTSQRFGQSPARLIQGRHESRGYGEEGLNRQTIESLKKQGVDHGNLGSREKLQGQGFGSQGNLEQKDLDTSGRSQQRDRTSAFSRFGDERGESLPSERGQFSRGSLSRGSSIGGSGYHGGEGGGFSGGGEGGYQGGGGGSHGGGGGGGRR